MPEARARTEYWLYANYMVEKIYYIATYLGTFGAYLMPQWPIYGSKGVYIYKKNDFCKVAVNSRYLSSGQKTISFVKNDPKDYMIEKTYQLGQYLSPFGAYLMTQWPILGSKDVPIY